MKAKTLIIGGSGFIGTTLGNLLQKRTVPFEIGDIRNSAAFPEYFKHVDVTDLSSFELLRGGKDVVLINLAAEHRDDVRPKSRYAEVNVVGAKNVCRFASEQGIQKIIFTSSVAVYGFAPPDTGENGAISPFNEYGTTKWQAEQVYRAWHAEDPDRRTLVIIRPTVVFGERNRGNVYNLLRQLALGAFIMVGPGTNRKSMAYVENVAEFIYHSATHFSPGIHTYNYVDKPDLTMNELVAEVRRSMNKPERIGPRLPYWFVYSGAAVLDLVAAITRKTFSISRIRVKKFCATTQFASSVEPTGFHPPVPLREAIRRTVEYEFVQDNSDKGVFYSE